MSDDSSVGLEEARSSDFVTSFAKGLAVIQSFGADAPRMTLSDVAERTGYSRATARRFLLTLVTLGFAESDGKFFELTPKVLCLGHAYLSSLNFWEAARPYLAEVTRLTHESSSAAVLDGTDVVYVARSAAPHRIMSVSLTVGTRLPAHATSMGQVLLAALPDDALRKYLSLAPFERFTRRTIVEAEALERRLQIVRQHAYAMADQELEGGLRSLAVPIAQNGDRVVAALNISTHSARVSKSTMVRDYLPHLICAAEKISAMSP